MNYIKGDNGVILNWDNISALYVEEDKFGEFDKRWKVKARILDSALTIIAAECSTQPKARESLKLMMAKALDRYRKVARPFEVVG
jgi:hypothetical protein